MTRTYRFTITRPLLDTLTLDDEGRKFYANKDQYLFVMVCSVTPEEEWNMHTIVSTTMIGLMKADIKRFMYQGINEWTVSSQSVSVIADIVKAHIEVRTGILMSQITSTGSVGHEQVDEWRNNNGVGDLKIPFVFGAPIKSSTQAQPSAGTKSDIEELNRMFRL